MFGVGDILGDFIGGGSSSGAGGGVLGDTSIGGPSYYQSPQGAGGSGQVLVYVALGVGALALVVSLVR